MYTGQLGALAGTDPLHVVANFGGGGAVVDPYVAPSLGLNYDERIDAAGFGNDRETGRPVRLTFDVPMNTVGVQFLYQDPREDGRLTAERIRLSAGRVTARFYDVHGTPIGDTSGLAPGANGGYLGGNFEGNGPQGASHVTAPIAAMDISMPADYGSEAWLTGAVPAGRVDYAALQASAAAANAAQANAIADLQAAAIAAFEAVSMAKGLQSITPATWVDRGVGTHAASGIAEFKEAFTVYREALARSEQSVGALAPDADARDRATLRDAAVFFATFTLPTVPPEYVAALADFDATLAQRPTFDEPAPVRVLPVVQDYVYQSPTFDTFTGTVPPLPIAPAIMMAPDIPPVVQPPAPQYMPPTALPTSPTTPPGAADVTAEPSLAAPTAGQSGRFLALLAIGGVGLWLGSRGKRRRRSW